MSARRERSTLKSAYLFEGTCHCRHCVHACNAVFTLYSIKLPPYGSYKASDTELEAIKHWAIDEARFEPSNLPANTPQPPPAKKARTGPLDDGRARRHTGCASAHLFRISRVTGGCWIVRVSAGRRYRSSGIANWMASSKRCQVSVVGCRSQALSQRL